MTPYEALRSDVAWIDLSGRGVIAVTGDDRARLLHAMSTNHVADLQSGSGLYAFFLSAQGRILADANIFNLGDSLLLDTEPELRNKLRDHLDKYIIADDAYLEDQTERWFIVGLEGPASLLRAQELGFAVPESPFAVSSANGVLVARLSSTGSEGVRIFAPIESKSSVVELLQSVPHVSASEARVVRIENGKARYGEEISERYLVQETGILEGVHPNKGCYLGQEIVERVRSRAQVHRHLHQIRIDGTAVPAAGTKLVADGKEVAEIVSAVYSPAWNAVAAFAYVRTEAVEAKPTMSVAGGDCAAVASIV